MTSGKRRLSAAVAIALASVVVVTLATGMLLIFYPGDRQRPFSELRSSDVFSADAVFGAYPPYSLSDDDRTELISLLGNIEISARKTTDPTRYQGAEEQFVLYMRDGTVANVSFCRPLFIVDGTAYRCDNYDGFDEVSQIYRTYVERIRAETSPEIQSP